MEKIREKLKELQAMDIKTARELLKVFVESNFNVHYFMFAIDKDRTLAEILNLAYEEKLNRKPLIGY